MRYSKVYIEAFGYELPPNVITSDDLELRLEPLYETLHFQKGQLEAITGIKERRFWDPGFKMHEGAIRAGQKALEASNISTEDVGMLIYGGVCRDNLEPATACAVSDGLGLGPETQIYDVSNACLGILNGIVQIANAIELGQIRAGLVVSCESARQIIDTTIERLLKTKDMEIFKKTVATLTGGSGSVAVVLTDGSVSASGHRLLGGGVRSAPAYHNLCRWGSDTGIPASGLHIMETDSVGVLLQPASKAPMVAAPNRSDCLIFRVFPRMDRYLNSESAAAAGSWRRVGRMTHWQTRTRSARRAVRSR